MIFQNKNSSKFVSHTKTEGFDIEDSFVDNENLSTKNTLTDVGYY